MSGEAKIVITVDGGDLAAGVLEKVAKALKDASDVTVESGKAAQEAGGLFSGFGSVLSGLFGSLPAQIAQGELMRDALLAIAGAAKDAVMALPELIGHSMELGNQLFEMSLKTGASVENLSALRFVASQTGIDFNSFSTTLVKMQQALGASGAKADEMQKHLDVLGLSLQTLKNEKPDQAFIDIMSALEAIPNRADQAAAGIAIFGRGFKEMAGLTQESITDLITEAKDLNLVMSTEQAAAAHAAEIGWKSLTMQFEAMSNSIASIVLPALVALEQLASEGFKKLVDGFASTNRIFSDTTTRDAVVKIGDAFIEGIAAAAGFAGGAIEGLKNVTAFAIRTGEALVNVAAVMIKVGTLGTVDEAGKTIIDKTQASLHATFDALEALKGPLNTTFDVAKAAFSGIETVADGMVGRFGAAFDKAQTTIADFAAKSHGAVGGVGQDVEGATAKISGLAKTLQQLADKSFSPYENFALFSQGVEAFGQAAFKATQEADLMGLAVPQAVREIGDAFEAEQIDTLMEKATGKWEKDLSTYITKQEALLNKLTDSIGKAFLEGAVQTITIDKQLGDEIAKQAQTTTDYQITKIWEWEAAQELAFKGSASQWGKFYDDLQQLVAVKIQGIVNAHDPLFQAMKKLQEDVQHGWVDLFDKTLVSTGSFKDAFVSVFKLIGTDVESIFVSLLGSVVQGFLQPLLNAVRNVASQIETALIEALAGDSVGGWGSLLASSSGGGGSSLMGGGIKAVAGGGAGWGAGAAGAAGSTVIPGAEFNPGVLYGAGTEGAGVGGALGVAGGVAGIGVGGWMLGNYLGSKTESKPLGAAMGAGAGAAEGAAIGSVVGPIGTGAGALIGAVAGAIAGWRAAGQLYEDTKKQQADLEKQFGGVEGEIKAVSDAYAYMGKTGTEAEADLKSLWDAKTPEAFGKAVEKVAGTLDAYQKDVLATQTAQKYGVSWTQLTPEIKQANLSAETNGLMTDFATLQKGGLDNITIITKMSGAFNQLYQDFKASGQQIPSTLTEIFQVLQSKGLLTIDAVKTDFAGLTSTAANYGITLEALGPQFQQANIDGRAKSIFDDFSALTAAGADVGGVLSGMSAAISQVVDDSMKFGTKVPANMKPLIDELARAGKLTDDSGKAITDVSKLTFEDTPVDKSLTDLGTSSTDLSGDLAGPGPTSVVSSIQAVIDAAKDIPTNPFSGWNVPDMSGLTPPAIHMAAGGIGHVTQPTYFLAGEQPGGEDFAFSGAGKSFASGASQTSGDAKVYVMPVLIRDRDRKSDDELVQDAVNEAIRQTPDAILSNTPAGLLSKYKGALGLPTTTWTK